MLRELVRPCRCCRWGKKRVCMQEGRWGGGLGAAKQMWGTGEQKGQRKREWGEHKALVHADEGKMHVVCSKFAR